MVLERGNYHIYLCCHLDWKPLYELYVCVCVCFNLKNIFTLIFRQRRREREWNIDVRGTHQPAASSCLPQGIKPTTLAWTLTWNQTGNVLLHGTMPRQLSHFGQSSLCVFFKYNICLMINSKAFHVWASVWKGSWKNGMEENDINRRIAWKQTETTNIHSVSHSRDCLMFARQSNRFHWSLFPNF